MARNKSRKTKTKSPPVSARYLSASRRRQAGKRAGRIPGVSVGNEVSTSVGKKKKVCFNVGGKWFFRMVDPVWRAPGRPHKAKKRKSAITPVEHPDKGPGSTGQGGRRSATKERKIENRDEKTVNSKQKTGERE